MPRKLFYSTDISVTLWILNNNKKARQQVKNGEERHYRDRENEVLFFDMRQMGVPYEKKFVELSQADRDKVTQAYHAWQQEGWTDAFRNEPEFCYSASLAEVEGKGFSLVPSKYIEFVNRDEQVDYETKLKALQKELNLLFEEEKRTRSELLDVLETLNRNNDE